MARIHLSDQAVEDIQLNIASLREVGVALLNQNQNKVELAQIIHDRLNDLELALYSPQEPEEEQE